ncbi:MAG TPA: HAD family hydrolase [bacterium]|nr:HAD family hydrolase [bacterium]
MASTSTFFLLLDFDGVISDSLHESFLTALNTYVECVPDHSLPLSKPLCWKNLHAFEKKESFLLSRFREMMPLANFAHDYLAVLMSIDQRRTIRNQQEFNAFKKQLKKRDSDDYAENFYRNRRRLRECHSESWSDLMKPFPGMVKSLKRLSRLGQLAIGSSKDRFSIRTLLDQYGLSECFPENRLLDKDFAETKKEHVLHFLDQGISRQKFHFIDDKISHLMGVKPLGVNLVLAGWGYNTPREHRLAEKAGIGRLSLDEFLRWNPGSQTGPNPGLSLA